MATLQRSASCTFLTFAHFLYKSTFGVIQEETKHTAQYIASSVLQKNVPELVEILRKVTSIVTWFGQSVVANDEQRQSGVNLKLIQGVEIRWNSIFFMLERFLALSSTVNSIVYRHHRQQQR